MDTLTATELRGLWVPIITPFRSDGSLDEEALSGLAARLLHDGATGLVALGTTGEPATLSPEERGRVVEICAAATGAAGASLIVGAGGNDTAATRAEIGRIAATGGAAAILVVVPYYTRPSVEAVVDHFHLVADDSPLPLVAYNIPYRTGLALGADALGAIADHPNVIGLKQAVGCLDGDTLQLLAETRPGFSVLAGDDAFLAPTILLGGTGAIAAAAHLCTRHFVALTTAAGAGDAARARALSAALLPVVRAGFAEPSPAVWKGALQQLGRIDHDGLRRPLTSASPTAVADLLRAEAAVAAMG